MQKLLLIALLAFSSAASGEYLCVAEEATGFMFDKTRRATEFNVDSSKFTIRKYKEDEYWMRMRKGPGYDYGVFKLGEEEDGARYRCHGPSLDSFVCEGPSGDFNFALDYGRFVRTYTVGYWNGQDNNKNNLRIEIGRCSKI